MLWIAVGVSFATLITLSCFESARRKHPLNYILLGVFTLCEAYLVGAISSTYDVEEVAVAVGITAVICLGLTLFAFQTKIDFTMKSGAMMVVLLGFMVFGLLMIWFHSRILRILYATIGAIIFSCYLVIDTQMLIGGPRHKLRASIDDAIFVALQLYLDVVNIFLFILQLVGMGGDRR